MNRIGSLLAGIIAAWALGATCWAQPIGGSSNPPTSDTLLTAPPESPSPYQLQLNQLNTRLDNLGWSLGKVTQLLRDDLTETTERAALEAHQTQTRLNQMEGKQSQLRQNFQQLQRQTDSLRREVDTLQGQDAELQLHQEVLADTLRQFARSTSENIENIRRGLFTYRLLIGLMILIAAAAAIAMILGIPKDRQNKALMEESLKLNARILALLDHQLQLMSLMGTGHSEEEKAINHALAVRVGIEIFRMQRGFEKIDPEVKGINALKHALGLLADEFIRQGYTIRDLTGQIYSKDSKISVKKSTTNDDITPGSPVIENVISPQILYRGEIVHFGEVDIAISPKDK